MRRSYWTDTPTWACNSAMFTFGIVLALLGTLLPSILQSTGMDPGRAGSLFLFLNLGAFLATFTGGPSFDRYGHRRILMTCSALAGTALLVLAQAQAYGGFALGALLLGIGGGGLNAGSNALVSDLYPECRGAALNRLGIFFGFGALSIPLGVGILTEAVGLKTILHATSLICLLPAVLFLLSTLPEAKHPAGFPVQEALSCLKSPTVVLFGVLLFFQSGNEISTSGWLTTYLVDTLALTPAMASLYLAAFWGALVAGRLLAAPILKLVSEAALVQLSSLLSALSLGLLIGCPGPWSSLAFSCTTGFLLSTIFPTVLGQASGRYPSISGTVMGVLICTALTGGMLIPWLAGHLVHRVGSASGLYLPMAGFLAVFILQTIIRSRSPSPRK